MAHLNVAVQMDAHRVKEMDRQGKRGREQDVTSNGISSDGPGRNKRPVSAQYQQQQHLQHNHTYQSVEVDANALLARIPTLVEVLSNTAPPPYTLSAFMAFLSQNHCLETLEFTLDASRYQQTYYSSPVTPPIPGSEPADKLITYWDRLINAYIRPGSPREVNLVGEERDRLLRIPNKYTPPAPEALDRAVYKITELMRESVLAPFLSSFQQQMQPSYVSELPFSHHTSSSMPLSVPNATSHLHGGYNGTYPSRGTVSAPSSHQQGLFLWGTASQQYGNAHGNGAYNYIPQRPTSTPQQNGGGIDWQSDNDTAYSDTDMDDNVDPMTPPMTPPNCGSSPTLSERHWKDKVKDKLKFLRSGSREP